MADKEVCSCCKGKYPPYEVVSFSVDVTEIKICRECAWGILKRSDAQERKDRGYTIDPVQIVIRTKHQWVVDKFVKWVEESGSPWFDGKGVAFIDVEVHDKMGRKEIVLVPIMSG